MESRLLSPPRSLGPDIFECFGSFEEMTPTVFERRGGGNDPNKNV